MRADAAAARALAAADPGFIQQLEPADRAMLASAEADVAKQCAAFGRGGCQVVSFSGQECVALATFIGSYRRRRWNLSFTSGGPTYPEAQSAAMGRCNSDERSQGRCQPRTAACADGR